MYDGCLNCAADPLADHEPVLVRFLIRRNAVLRDSTR
jgi:hypothetical protein